MATAIPDYFALFNLEPCFALDPTALEAAYKSVQSRVHPDRFAAATEAEKRVAMQWAAHANEAYRTLRSPARRAAYLCEKQGVPLDTASSAALPPAFLMQQLEWREALDEAARADDSRRLDEIAREAAAVREQTLESLCFEIDEAQDFPGAAALARQLMFIDKLREEIGAARHQREEAD
jgi:molecular chaperone HscB